MTRLSGDPAVRAAGGTGVGTAVASPTGSSVWWTMQDTVRSRHNVFAWRDGEVRFVRGLITAFPRSLGGNNPTQVSADGSALVFSTSSRIDDGIMTRANTRAVYRLGLDGRIDCLSCPDGRTVTAAAGVGDTSIYMGAWMDPRISRDGSAIAFETRAGLVPADTNQATDVYLWRDGVRTLVSSGIAPDGNEINEATLRYAGMSWDATTVFFTSWGAFAPGSRDEYNKLYAARIGGGFPPDGAAGCGVGT